MAYIDRLFVLFIIAGFFTVPWLIEWASLTSVAWYKIYIAWFVIIFSAFWASRGKDLDDF